ncbi:MAG: hypothetical protein IAE80_02365 [Anaerolinea sp.]|nr:hypothetical protein [Anaerolinea sp.]
MPRRIQFASGLFLLLLIALFSMTPMQTTEAQTGGPTATPNDPLWLAFAGVRDALEDKFSVDLTIVQRWTFEEYEFVDGIDSCVTLDDPTTARLLYFGWRFIITGLNGRQYEGRSSFDHTIITACDTVTEASPAATAAPGTGLPAPVAGAGATGSFELGGHVLEISTNAVNLARRSGMTWIKKQVRYTPGQDASSAAGLINAAHTNGFKILLGIVGDRNALGANFDSYIQGFASYLGSVAAAGADAIEVWNEPNLDREWPTGQVNGASYTRMLAAAFNAIKGSNANTIVISAAPAPTGFWGSAGCAANGCNDDTFMQQMSAAGAANYMDCVGLHYNEGIIPPSQTSGDPRGGYPTYYFQSMLGRGLAPFGGKPACWTELGYLTPAGYSTPLPANFAWGQNTTVAQQASWLADAAVRSAQSGRVRLMIVWNVDFSLYTADDPQGGYAMLRPDGSCPACDALGTVMRR